MTPKSFLSPDVARKLTRDPLCRKEHPWPRLLKGGHSWHNGGELEISDDAKMTLLFNYHVPLKDDKKSFSYHIQIHCKFSRPSMK